MRENREIVAPTGRRRLVVMVGAGRAGKAKAVIP